MLARSMVATRPVCFVNGCMDVLSVLVIPLANIDKMPLDRGRCGHSRRDQVRAAPLALAAFEVAVAVRSTPLARLQLVGVHGQAHAASGFAPFEPRLFEDAV